MYTGKADSNAVPDEEVANTYELEMVPGGETGDGGDGGPGKGKNKGANSLGIGFNASYAFMNQGFNGETFFGVPIRIISNGFGAASYFNGLNISKSRWEKFKKDGTLFNSTGYLLMHEYGHYLQREQGGFLWYYSYVVLASLQSNSTNGREGHSKHWAEIQASTLGYHFFGRPDGFLEKKENNIVKDNYYSKEIINNVYNQYINHPDYKP